MAARTEAWRRNANIGASCLTGSAVIALTNPLDCLKSRFQVAPHSGGGVAAFARALVAGDGLWRGLWRPGLATNVCACTISVGTRIGLYPTLRDSFAPAEARRSPLFMYASGLAGGALGYSVAAPFFYATRVAHVRDLGPGLATPARGAARRPGRRRRRGLRAGLLAARGPRVFVRGWLPLWARFLPSTVLTFLIYEQARKLLLGDFLR
ncbi:thiosulfate transmembrane transporter [Aureococcus anophagefferens]|nr:thiosulfate transmembrane transporter [Aureococcus anophagefferens]